MKLPDWIQELYLKEVLLNARTKGEKTHDKNRQATEKIKRNKQRNR